MNKIEILGDVNKMKRQELLLLSGVELYKLILDKKLDRFPDGFWQLPDAEKNAIECTKYMIEEVLKWSDEEIKSKLKVKTFYENKLSVIMARTYSGSVFRILNDVYPNKFKPWELKNAPMNFWDIETGILATKWLIDEKLKLTDEEIKTSINQKLFKQHGLAGMLNLVFNSSPVKAICSSYPNRFKEWQFKTPTNGFWNVKTTKEATKWLFEEQLKWDIETIKNKIYRGVFAEYGVSGLLNYFNGSILDILKNAYPKENWDDVIRIRKNK